MWKGSLYYGSIFFWAGTSSTCSNGDGPTRTSISLLGFYFSLAVGNLRDK